MLRYLPERQSLSYAATRPKSLDLMLSLIDSRPEAAGLTVNELIRGRALVLDEMAARSRASTGGEDAVRLRTLLSSAERRLANLVIRGPSNQTPAQYQALLADARREKEAAERALAENSADARAELSRAAFGIEDVTARAAFQRNSALLRAISTHDFHARRGPALLAPCPLLHRVSDLAHLRHRNIARASSPNRKNRLELASGSVGPLDHGWRLHRFR
jgi:hypothetical protein